MTCFGAKDYQFGPVHNILQEVRHHQNAEDYPTRRVQIGLIVAFIAISRTLPSVHIITLIIGEIKFSSLYKGKQHPYLYAHDPQGNHPCKPTRGQKKAVNRCFPNMFQCKSVVLFEFFWLRSACKIRSGRRRSLLVSIHRTREQYKDKAEAKNDDEQHPGKRRITLKVILLNNSFFVRWAFSVRVA